MTTAIAPQVEVASYAPCPWDVMLRYQKDWMLDQERFKHWRKSRQIGGSAAVAAEAVEDCLSTPGQTWVIGSVTEELAKEFLLRVNAWADICHAAIAFFNKEEPVPNDKNQKALVTKFDNRSRVIAVAANPRSMRSYSANVILDEAAHMEDSTRIYEATFPMVTRGGKKLRLVSSCNGKLNMFYKLDVGDNDYSKHVTTIYDAVRLGLDIDPEVLKRNLNNQRSWEQEFECQYLDANQGDALIMMEWVERCMSNSVAQKWKHGTSSAMCDVAYTPNGDENVFGVKRGNRILPLQTFQGAPEAIVNWFLDRFNLPDPENSGFRLHPHEIAMDGHAGAQIILGMLRNKGWPIRQLLNNARANDPTRFADRVTEAWFHAAMAIQQGDLILPPDDTLLEQLCTRKMVRDERGRMKLESKRLLLDSPDRADVVVELLAYQPAHVVGSVGGNYDPSERGYTNKQFISFDPASEEFDESENTGAAMPRQWSGYTIKHKH